MTFIKYLENSTTKYDLLNKFIYSNLKKFPKLEKASLNFGCLNNSYQNLATNFLALEFISKQKGLLTKAKKPNLTYKIRKKSPTGCKVTLRKQKLNRFISLFINEIFPNSKNFNGVFLNPKLTNFVSYDINNVFIFPEIEKNYIRFKNLPKLQTTLVFQSLNNIELKFLVKSLQFVIKNNWDKWSRGLRRQF